MRYAHLVHVDGEAGDVDYETVLESRDGFQLTYGWLRETEDGSHVAELRDDRCWYVEGDDRPYSDVTFSDEVPEPVAMNDAALIEVATKRVAIALREGVGAELIDRGATGDPGEFWVERDGRRFLVTVVYDSSPASDEEIDRSFDAYR